MLCSVKPRPKLCPLATDKRRDTALLILNPQIDICHPKGKAFVNGANDDMQRLSAFITDNVSNIDKILISLDYNKTSMGSFLLKGTIGAAIIPAIELAVYGDFFAERNEEPFILQRQRLSWQERDSGTKATESFENTLKRFRKIIVAGEAKNLEILDFLEFWEKDYGQENVVLLKDCSSELKGYEHNSKSLYNLRHSGLRVCNSEDVF